MGLFDNFGIGNPFGFGFMRNNLIDIVLDENPMSGQYQIDLLGEILTTLKEMNKDELNHKVEMARLDSQMECYTMYVELNKNKLEKSFELEEKLQELIKFVVESKNQILKEMKTLNKWNKKYKTYREQLEKYDIYLERLTSSMGIYYNKNNIEGNIIKLP